MFVAGLKVLSSAFTKATFEKTPLIAEPLRLFCVALLL